MWVWEAQANAEKLYIYIRTGKENVRSKRQYVNVMVCAAIAATVIFKNTIRQWQCIFTLVGQMIPVNGLLSLARTRSMRHAVVCIVHRFYRFHWQWERANWVRTMTVTVMYTYTLFFHLYTYRL